ncbi:MAG: DUF433 domain-containing protein [Candidatus Hodarchaeales archaeon]
MPDPSRISINPEICHGKPCIKGTRIPVYLIIEMLEHGLTFDEILKEYPHITVEDIKSCLQFAKKLIENKEIFPFVSIDVSS